MPPGDSGPVAVCTLADRALAAELSQAPGVSLAGPLLTANLGITRLIWAVLERPWIRILLMCGTDSPLFRAGESLVALFENGVSEPDRRIIGADGYVPVLHAMTGPEVAAFREQVDLVDDRGERDAARIRARSAALADQLGWPHGPAPAGRPEPVRHAAGFRMLRPGGRREPVASAGDGFFVIFVDHADRRIVLEHYWPDYRPGHQIRGVRAESMLLGAIDAGLTGCPRHAGYLGMELAKAEIALRLGLDYEQDKPVRAPTREEVTSAVADLDR